MRVWLVAAAMAAFGAVSTAAAQTEDENWAYCVNDNEVYSLDEQIAGCSRIIAAGDDTPVNIAIAYQNRGNGYNRQDNHERAIVDYNEAIRLNPNFANAYYNRGVAYGDMRRYDEAIADYTQALALDPQHGDSYGNRGHAHYMQGRLQEALADLDRALTVRHTAVDFGNRGAVYYDLGEYTRALADFDQALLLNPRSSIDFNSRGNVYYQLRDYDRALVDYNRAIEADPRNAIALRNRGLVYSLREDHAGAVENFSAAIGVDPNYAAAYFSRAESYADLRDYEHALIDYDAAAARQPDNSEYNNLACWVRAAYLNRDYEAARGYCDRAVELAGGESQVANARDSRAMLAFKQGRYQDAWDDYDAAVRAQPDSAHYLYGRGVTALRLGRRVEGEGDIVRARLLNAGVVEAYVRYGVEPPPQALTPLVP